MKTVLTVFLLCLASATCFCGSLGIYNDSPFPLTATILSADGQVKGSLTVNPYEQSSWQDPSPANQSWSQTPYSVIFKCKSGKVFGTFYGANQGAWVSASQVQGPRICEVNKKNQSNGASKSSQPPSPDQQHDLNLGPP